MHVEKNHILIFVGNRGNKKKIALKQEVSAHDS